MAIMTPQYDHNGNQTSEHFDDGRPIDSNYIYGLDDQLLESLSETKHKSTSGYPGNPASYMYNRTFKRYTYELGGKKRLLFNNMKGN
ncbi:MAG: hypothetical protein ACM3ZC_08635 [Bacteroidota bacterium]